MICAIIIFKKSWKFNKIIVVVIIIIIIIIIIITIIIITGQVDHATSCLATRWRARVRSQMVEGWGLFFSPWCPDWSWGPPSLL